MVFVPSINEYTGPYCSAQAWNWRWASRVGIYHDQPSVTCCSRQLLRSYLVKIPNQWQRWRTRWEILGSPANPQQGQAADKYDHQDTQDQRRHIGAALRSERVISTQAVLYKIQQDSRLNR